MNLVIIESSGKLETIKKYLGSEYEVVATNGHFRDLPARTLAVDIDNNFEPNYQITPDKASTVKMLKQKAKNAKKIYLATDPDREGEAISWHLSQVLELDENDKNRIIFNEISKNAILEALKKPRAIDKKLVDAQQARRVLDRLVGYKLSPVISKKIQPRLSAGRVQSAALKILVDREKSILNFKPVEYWTLNASVFKDIKENAFKTTLTKFKNKKATINNKDEMDAVLSTLKQNDFVVSSVKKSVRKTKPYAPYVTSTMQQDASVKLGFTLKKTSFTAQQLYEGVEIKGEGKVALITYIRTDSVRVAPQAVAMAKDYILENYGEKYYPKKPNFYKSKSSAQDAHEAIRPISLDKTPEMVREHISNDNYRLYKLIYERFLASQMSEATYNMQVIDIKNGDYEFRATGKTPIFDGFQRVYKTEEVKKTKKKKDDEDDEDENEDDANNTLPELNEKDVLKLLELKETQKFTKPLPRFRDDSLVNEMEKRGIGRPATYAATVTTLATRNYTEKEGRYLKPTELGIKVSDMLEMYFADIVDTEFTAQMEDKLDSISFDDIEWQDVVGGFYKDFEKQLKNAGEDTTTFKIPPKETSEKCDKCGSMMLLRTGQYGEFLACSAFPKCRNIVSLNKPKVAGVCPDCGSDVHEKKSRKGKTFYGCSAYPKCKFASSKPPVAKKDEENKATNENKDNKNDKNIESNENTENNKTN